MKTKLLEMYKLFSKYHEYIILYSFIILGAIYVSVALMHQEQLKFILMNNPKQIEIMVIIISCISFLMVVFFGHSFSKKKVSNTDVYCLLVVFITNILIFASLSNNISRKIMLNSGANDIKLKFYLKKLQSEMLYMVDVRVNSYQKKDLKDVEGNIVHTDLKYLNHFSYTIVCKKNGKALMLTDCYNTIMKKPSKDFLTSSVSL